MNDLSEKQLDLAITYGWNRVGYNILRSIAKHNLRVAVGDYKKNAMAKKSKYCQCEFLYPNFYTDPQNFISSIRTTLNALKPKVYFPVHEEIFIIAKYIDQFSDLDIKIPIHDFQTLKSVHKKDSFAEIAAKLNLPIPRTIKPSNISELKDIWQALGRNGKVVIKSINSNSAKGVFYASSYEELCAKYSELTRNIAIDKFPIIQEYVAGAGYGVSMLFNRGQLRAKFTHKRLREKIATGGTSTKRISAKNSLIEQYAEHLLSSLNWHGVAMVEFIVNEKDNKVWIIEVNPRFWGSLALAIHSGVDFPFLLYKIAIDGDVEPVLNYKMGVLTRWLLGDVLATISYIKSQKSLKPILNFLNFKGEKYDDLYWDDLMPFFAQGWYYLSKFIKTGNINPIENALIDVDNI